jgi:inosine-uridine nucleoside N-ribohydrolase
MLDATGQVCGNVPVDRATANIQILFHYLQRQEVPSVQ